MFCFLPLSLLPDFFLFFSVHFPLPLHPALIPRTKWSQAGSGRERPAPSYAARPVAAGGARGPSALPRPEPVPSPSRPGSAGRPSAPLLGGSLSGQRQAPLRPSRKNGRILRGRRALSYFYFTSPRNQPASSWVLLPVWQGLSAVWERAARPLARGRAMGSGELQGAEPRTPPPGRAGSDSGDSVFWPFWKIAAGRAEPAAGLLGPFPSSQCSQCGRWVAALRQE